MIGAGSTNSQWVQLLKDLNIKKALLIESDKSKFIDLKENNSNHNWNLKNTIIGEGNENCYYYEASYKVESGLVKPETLQKIWPNISTLKKIKCTTTPLSEALKKEEKTPNWLLIDCLPALSIIQGLGTFLDNINVIVARSILTDHSPKKTKENLMTDYLSSLGFNCLATEKEQNLAIGHSLYYKETNFITKVTEEKSKTDLLSKSQKLLEETTETLNEQTELNKKQLDTINQLTHKKEKSEKLAITLQTQINDFLKSQEGFKAKTKQLMEKIESQEIELKTDKEKLQNQILESNYRLKKTSEEFIRIEAQMELIKDISFHNEK
ncbi:MAG: hypothetical protein V3U71_13750 [Cocleimonas sp.]